MMQSSEAGEKISKIELVELSPADLKKIAEMPPAPTGGKVCLPSSQQKARDHRREKDANGSSSSHTENMIAEKDGKFVIPVPGPCK